MEPLTRDNLGGVWAAIATPFDEDDRFDAGVFRENLRRLHAASVHGIYTTDADGEFYAIEFDEFTKIVDVLADEADRLGFATQIGATWSHTKGVAARLSYAASRGILGAHVGHPIYLPMTPESLEQFWLDISEAVPEWFGLMHYNTPRCPNYLRGADYARLAERVPKLIGTKHVGTDFGEFQDLIALSPQLAHLVTEPVLTPYTLFGARGVNSWFVNFNPTYMLDWHDDLTNGRWDQARLRQDRLSAFMRSMDIFHIPGNLHGIVGKALTAASPFLVPATRTRRPYLSIQQEDIETFRRMVDEHFSDLKWDGNHLRP